MAEYKNVGEYNKYDERKEKRQMRLGMAVVALALFVTLKGLPRMEAEGGILPEREAATLPIKEIKSNALGIKNVIIEKSEVYDHNKERILDIFSQRDSREELSDLLDHLGYNGGLNFSFGVYIDESNLDFYTGFLGNEIEGIDQSYFIAWKDGGYQKISSLDELVGEEVTIEGTLSQ